jgi:hypothetical protein
MLPGQIIDMGWETVPSFLPIGFQGFNHINKQCLQQHLAGKLLWCLNRFGYQEIFIFQGQHHRPVVGVGIAEKRPTGNKLIGNQQQTVVSRTVYPQKVVAGF